MSRIYRNGDVYGEFKCRIGQTDRCMENGCSFYHAGLQKCASYDKEKKNYIKGEKNLLDESVKKFINSGKQKTHIWVGAKTGIVYASYKEFKPRGKKGERFKYLGYTITGINYPITLNTGRILHKPKTKRKKLS